MSLQTIDELRRAVADARRGCANVEARSVRRGLQEFASRQLADLLVVGATGRDELGREFIDDTRKVLEDAPCAVAVAPAGFAARAPALARVGVAYDGSAPSERALALARTLATERRAELSAFEAVRVPLGIHDVSDLKREDGEGVQKGRRRLAGLGDLSAEAAVGDPVEELARYGRSVDLLVVGSHHYRPIDRLLEHSTSQRLADEGSSPLLVLSETTLDQSAGRDCGPTP